MNPPSGINTDPQERWMKRTAQVFDDESGVTAIEYSLIGALLAMTILGGVSLVGAEVLAMYLRVCTAVVTAIGGGAC